MSHKTITRGILTKKKIIKIQICKHTNLYKNTNNQELSIRKLYVNKIHNYFGHTKNKNKINKRNILYTL
ncbi:hypothetical protein PFTANZ_06114 [Plasmodium falciparum Tanzania (2000708)]|uniref:Uncharacterized protein n=2 Tax=Plasmodium falciparum TaxID=5833 RepID=A0A024VZ18_PLAFA|nr:hypothetical protein PFTANZ_06114 [Plasmodium falciparum Tanzania (2000708)]ETW42167.1 hypothetical protein PFNF135_03665 [Plasmodium falciparum NF135/5.C10]